MPYLGLDIGSVSVKVAWVDGEGRLLASTYRRHLGKPLEAARRLLDEELARAWTVDGMAVTGGGGKMVADALGVPFENEVLCQARAASALLPQAKSLIVVGGEDSFLILLEEGGISEAVRIRDFAMNGLCAAGAGSFLDQQASRLGVEIEGAFGALALESQTPARVAGRCSVFAKTDMIHLQQKGTPVQDIVAGLCFAFARNFLAVIARGKDIRPPVAFAGGVALNGGMVRAFRESLGLTEDEFLVPEHAATAGAAGAALYARSQHPASSIQHLASSIQHLVAQTSGLGDAMPPLPDPGPPPPSRTFDLPEGARVDAYLGVDIGSISTNVVLIDADKRVLAKEYLMTAGRPIVAVRQGLANVGAKFADKVTIKGVCTTGSGRYLVADFIGADVVKNEITAQARAAAEIDPLVDTIFEIGGQDSKYISLDGGAIVDFEMNKVCAAGTGSFLEEQAERLGVNIKGEFAARALSAKAPVRLGERCTVFMESDLVGQQARGATTEDLAAGLAYSTVYNYLNRVVAERKVGSRIFFQGGTAFNRAVVSAFGAVTGKPITVPEHHEVTGALGCALMAMEYAEAGAPSTFRGFDLATREYTQDSFECKACANCCTINRVRIAGEATLFYGGRCEKYEKKRVVAGNLPDLFAERNAWLMEGYTAGAKQPGKPLVGIAGTLHCSEYAPYWTAFFASLGIPVRYSAPTDAGIIRKGLDTVAAEFCFPVKVAHGHVEDLIAAGVTHLFLPNVQHLPKLHPGFQESVPCPYVSSLAFTIRAALDPEARGVEILSPVIDITDTSGRYVDRLAKQLEALGVHKRDVAKALQAAAAAQAAFGEKVAARGREVLAALGPNDKALVVIGRPYNSCDPGMNLEIPLRFREMGALPIPMDMLPLEQADLSAEFPDLTWRYGQKILAAGELIREDARLSPVYITNFGCGPDSFLLKFFRAKLGSKTCLTLEIDEHSSDVGVITRCEAFLDSLRKAPALGTGARSFRVNYMTAGEQRTIYLPHMTDEAYAIAAAFRSVGQPAQVLPSSDADSAALGKQHCTGKECFPCIVTTGDFVKLLEREDTDPDKVAFFMPSVAGGCRFGYYNVLQRLILDELGHPDIPIFAPNQSRGLYDTLGGKAGDAFVRRGWQGIVAVELLTKALHHVRPEELTPGRTEQVYQEYLAKTCAALERGEDLAPVMQAARQAFEAIPVSRDIRPWIGLVGEVFVRMHDYSNQDLIRQVEALGGKVWLAPLTEWIYYVNVNQQEDAHLAGQWLEVGKLKLVDQVMQSDEHHLAKAWEGFIPNLHEPPVTEAIEDGSRYVDPAFRGEAVLGLGKSRQFHRLGLAGIINVMPFTCMPGIITTGLFKRFQQDHDDMPVLNLAFEGAECGDLHLRLEAFLQQCKGYKERVGV